jgi:signal transduction histidine kinase/CheY-like chemotaxis protein
MNLIGFLRRCTPQSLRSRLMVAISIVIGVIALFLYLYLPYRLQREARVAMVDKARSIGQMTAFSISAAVVFGDTLGMRDALTIARQNTDLAYIIVLDPQQQPLAAWAAPGVDPANLGASGEFDADAVRMVRIPIHSNGADVGAIDLGLSMRAVHDRIRAARQITLMVCLVIFVGGVMAVFAISLHVTRPLDALAETVGRIAAGDMSQRAPPASSTEVARLVDAFNVMVDRLALAQTQLTGFNRDLEMRVEDRTAALLAIQEQLVSARDLAEAGSRAKSEFLANMSHEIRTPMNGVLGTLELARDTQLTPVQREYIDLAHGSAETLLAIINDILDFSKIEAGMMVLERIGFNLQETVDSAVSSMALRAHTQGLELAVRVAPDVPDWITADPGRIRQVLVNLIGNAIKFTPAGEVVLTVATAPAGQLHLTVSDTGIGISEEKQRLIFEAFSQADASTTRQYGGTGLGLTISAQLVNLMGGRIWVESAPNVGSRFHFTIDYAPAPALSQPVGAPLESLQGVSVLIVDDNATNRLILRDTVAGWGMLPETAESGAAALVAVAQRVARGEPFKLFLLDVNMPQMDGFALATRLRQMVGSTDKAIMMLTSATRTGDVERCLQLGIASHLSKPIRRTELKQAVGAVLHHDPGIAHGLRTDARTPILPLPDVVSLRILLVEDNRVNQRVAAGFLARYGHSVEIAENGRIAVDEWSRGQFDLIFMDVQMPVMGGFEATRTIRELEHSRGSARIPIVALTAHAMLGDREACLDAGMDDYLVKPIQGAELTRVLRGIKPQEPSPALVPVAEPESHDIEDAEILREAGQVFLESYDGLMSQTRVAMTTRAWPELKRAAHSWKGSVGYFGAPAAVVLARQLEQQAASEDSEGAETTFAMLEIALNRLQSVLRDRQQ